MKKFIFCSVILGLMLTGSNLYAQNKTSKPLMKITVKDGKVVKTEPYDTIKSHLKISDTGEDNNFKPDKAIRKSMSEDGQTDPGKAVRSSMSEKGIPNPAAGVRSSMSEDTTYNPHKVARSPLKTDPSYNPDKAVRTSMNEDANYKPGKTKITAAFGLHEDTQKKAKGTNSTGKIEFTKAVFDTNVMGEKKPVRTSNVDKKSTKNEVQTLDSWLTILSEGFEGVFPGTWNVFAGSEFANAYWGDVTYRAYTGSWSGFCAAEGTASVAPGSNYPNNMNTWMISGPLDLSDAVDGFLSFNCWYDTETDYDYLKWMVSLDGITYYGYQVDGNSGGWVSDSLDFKNVPTLGDITGQSQVYLAFAFQSDESYNYKGAYIDNITVQKYIISSEQPDLTMPYIDLSTESWVVDSTITADLTEENIGTGYAIDHSTNLYLSSDTYISSSEDILLSSDITSYALAAGESQVLSTNFTVPDVTDGTYYVGAIIDYYDVVDESDETNNIVYLLAPVTVSHPAVKPDLAWSFLSLSSTIWNIGSSVTAGLTIENYGEGEAGYQYSRIYLSTDDYISVSDMQLGSDLYFSSISAGYNQVQSSTFTVPSGDGTYYVGALVDFYNAVDESDETNNGGARSGTVTIIPGDPPDLTITSIALSSLSWVVGGSITADLTEENTGLGNAIDHSTRLYLSADTYISSSEDVQLGTDITCYALAAGGIQVLSPTFTVPEVTDGTYYVGVMVDYYGVVNESNETNNILYRTGAVTLTHTTPEIDLTWTSMALSADTWEVGSNITANLTEENYGNISSGSHYTRLYLSTNNIISTSDTQLGTDMSFGSISAGGYLTVSSTFTVPSVSDGTWYVGGMVDYYNDVAESNEDNNILYRIGTVDICNICGELPDLVWVYMALSESAWAVGNSITADLSVKNIGESNAGTQYSKIYLSDNDIISSSDTQLGSDISYGAINPGDSLTVSETFAVPEVADGLYYMGAIVDFYDDVPEINESNNGGRRSGTVTISGADLPDLEWTNMTLTSTSWTEGDGVTAGLTVVNNSTTAPAAGQYSRIYLSENDIISTTDVQLGSDLSFNATDPSGSQVQSLSFTVPFGNMTYYVGAIVDIYNDVLESDENNNGGFRSGTVTITPNSTDFPDLAPTSMALTTDQWAIGASITANVTEENFGTLAAGAYYSRLVLSDNTVISESDLQLGSDLYFTGIAAGASLTVNSTFTVPDVTSGVYYVGIMTDVNNSVTESDESNNIQYRVGTVNIVASENTPDINVSPLAITINEVVGAKSASPVSSGSGNPVKKASSLSNQQKAEYVPNRIIVKFRSNVGSNISSLNAASNDLQTLNTKYNVSVIKQLGRSVRQLNAGNKGNLLLIRYENGSDIFSVIEEFKKLEIVEFAEPDYIMKYDQDVKPDYVPNDPFYTSQWGLKNTGNAVSYTGSKVGTAGEDINIEPAWDISLGSSSIIVAVIDCGIDLTHSEFSGRLVSGYDFVNDDSDPSPLPADGHGTSCAGIIAAGNDEAGVIGVAPLVKIMPIKSMEDGTGSYSAIADGIYYAVDNGARVISMSLGGSEYSLALEAAVNYAVNNNVIVLAAAGNDGTDNLVAPHYPSSYENCIAVGAMSPCGLRKTETSCDGEFWWGSNYGDLDFIAPGTRIYTTDNTGSGGYTTTNYLSSFNGTSSACPFAAGVAALILSVNPSLTPDEVRLLMQSSSTDVGTSGYDSETGFGRLDAFAALQLAQTGGTDLLTITNLGTGTLTVSSITHNKAWLTTSNYTTPFNLAANERVVIQANVDWGIITASETGTITISSNDSDEPAVNVDVTANALDVEIYNISVSTNPTIGGTVEGSGQYGLNQTIDLIAKPAAQYTFVNWTETGVEVSTNPVYTFTVSANRNLVANFALISPVISATASPVEGGTIAGAGIYDFGTTATLTATPAANYQFVNWTENGEVVSTNSTYDFVVTEDRSLIATFSPDPYSIAATSNPTAGGTITGTGFYLLNQTANLTANPVTGYEFTNWKENNVTVSVNSSYIFSVNRSRVLVANYVLRTINITVSASPTAGGTVSGSGTFGFGEEVNLTATPATGYHFVSWTEGSIEVSKSATYTFTASTDRTLVANFEINSYTITASADPTGGGTITGTGTFIHGTNVSLSAIPATGHHFIKWTENSAEVSTNASYSFIASADRVLVAVFELNTYTITLTGITPENSGTITGTGNYFYGTTADLVAIPSTGYHFLSWKINNAVVSISPEYSFTVTSNVSVEAYFEINSYNITVTIEPLSTGTVTGDGVYEHGSDVTLQATAVTGYHFLNWTENNVEVSANATYSFTATSEKDLIANFEINSYNITASADPPGSGTITGTGVYTHGSNVSLTAIASTDYYFVNWTENSAQVSTSANYTFSATGERDLSANFNISAPGANPASNIAQTSFKANWRSSAAATGYRLDVSENNGFTSFVSGFNNKNVSNVTNYIVTGLSARTTYYYRVRAFNSYETSNSSTSINLTTLSEPSSVPQGVSSSSCNDKVTLIWQPSTGSYFDRYRIYGGTESNPVTRIDSVSGISNTSRVISGLARSQTYYFRIVAVNDDGVESEFSSQTSVKVKPGVIPKITGKWGNQVIICSNLGDSITSYQWYKDASKITSGTGQYYVTNGVSGAYIVETIDENGCKNSSNTISTSGKSSLNVYPNPVSKSFTLMLDGEIEGQAIVSIINSKGIKVKEYKLENVKEDLLNEIDVESLDEGIYIVRVLVNQQELFTTKIVVSK